MKQIPISSFQWFMDELSRHDLIHLSNGGSYQGDPDYSPHILLGTYASSILAVPLQAQNKTIGLLGIGQLNRERIWSDSTITLLKTVASIISNSMERSRTEMTLRESEERYRAISEYTHAAICMINEQGRIFWVNRNMLDLTGYSLEHILQADSFSRFIAPESLDLVVGNFSRYIAKEPYLHHYFFSLLCAGGVKRMVEIYTVDILDSEGKSILIVNLLDISEKVKMEEVLIEHDKSFRSFLDAIPEAVLVTSPDGLIHFSNTSCTEIFRHSPEDISRLPIWDLIPEEHKKTLKNLVARAIAGEKCAGSMEILPQKGGAIGVDIQARSGRWNRAPVVFIIIQQEGGRHTCDPDEP